MLSQFSKRVLVRRGDFKVFNSVADKLSGLHIEVRSSPRRINGLWYNDNSKKKTVITLTSYSNKVKKSKIYPNRA